MIKFIKGLFKKKQETVSTPDQIRYKLDELYDLVQQYYKENPFKYTHGRWILYSSICIGVHITEEGDKRIVSRISLYDKSDEHFHDISGFKNGMTYKEDTCSGEN